MSPICVRHVLCVVLLSGGGCGGAPPDNSPPSLAAREPAPADRGLELALAQGPEGRAGEDPPRQGEVPGEQVQRRIIFTGDLRLIVEEFDGVPDKVADLVERFDGFVAQAQIRGASGSPRSAKWTVRIPVKRYDEFVSAARDLGEVQNSSSDSKDVTEEYYDVEARIRNKEVEEQRLLRHLSDSTGKLEEILAVEREVSRVRDELERMQGRLRVLKDLVMLTTVTLHIDEIKGYLPPHSPALGARIGRAFAGSIEALRQFAEELLILAVVVAPWLIVPGTIAGAVLLFARRRRRLA